MPRMFTRTAAGSLTTAFVAAGAVLAAPAASADTERAQTRIGSLPTAATRSLDPSGGDVRTFEYLCESPEIDEEWNSTWAFRLTVPEEAEVGEEVHVKLEWAGELLLFTREGIKAGDATAQGTLELGGDAAPQERLVLSGANPEDIAIAGSAPFEIPLEAGGLTPAAPGEITFVPGEFTADIVQESGSTANTCRPVGEVDELATITVTGEPQDPEPTPSGEPEPTPSDEPEPTPTPEPTGEDEEPTPEPTDGAGGGDDGEDKPTPEPSPTGDDGDQADGGLPVTGAALGGLVAAGAVALGGGGAAMYLSRRRKSAEDRADESGEA
ncbi:hypothetical protein HDA32_000369 [Spinactinospora alkalitolerans]|uniref:LPXTG cell wall anchor domain-containing protein n=1 Tax=Spinactinospora alkalitolerans TaxID=687207 RepID=A0A852TMS2_9ACTN|nr:hypothetical protein [Spinactinospora alkalitolerans]NYE45249.1 hypothetical protein [Spinactinospora alkalitolerans]